MDSKPHHSTDFRGPSAAWSHTRKNLVLPNWAIHLHAADPNDDFIHSYTSTLSALVQANAKCRPSDIDASDDPVMAIGIPEIPQKPRLSLPCVSAELDVVEAVVGESRFRDLTGAMATKNRVSEYLNNSSWLHLACHGQQHPTEPLSSGLLLYDALPRAQSVFLSACQTAMGDIQLANEAMHLTGGLIFAGYCGAIGTIADNDGPKVAKVVYEHLFSNGKKPDIRQAARALQLAVRKLRDEGAPPQR